MSYIKLLNGGFAMENVVSLDEMKAEFLAFCIEAYKMKLGVSGGKVAEYLQDTGLLDFLLENYDMLHTIGRKQLIGEMESFIANREGKNQV